MSGYGHLHTAETKAKLRESHLGKRHTVATRKKISALLTGRPVSRATRRKLSATLRGHPVSQSTRCKISAANKGRRRCEAEKKKWARAYVKAVVPNSPECNILSLLKRYNLSHRFKFSPKPIGCRVPDFLDEKNKIVIEYFGTRHDEQFRGWPRQEEEADRKFYFQRYGYSTVIIWFDDPKWKTLAKLRLLQLEVLPQ